MERRDEVVEAVTARGERIEIGPIHGDEHDELVTIFSEVVDEGDSYPQAPPLLEEDFEAAFGHASAVVAARWEAELFGAYYLKANHPGRAAHIANAGYLVARRHRRRGFGRALVLDSIERAPHFGFDAIQFNLVFSSNPARRLYEELGWIEIGRLPRAVEGIDAVIYWRALDPP